MMLPPAAAGPLSPLRLQPTDTNWHAAEGAARAAGLIIEVPLPLQVLSGLQGALPPAPQHTAAAADADGAADTAAVGRFGEELAYSYYLQHPEMQQQLQDAVRVEWVNQQAESWLPFDLVVRDVASGSVLCYVEVKASRDAAKQFFELSERELSFAAREGDRYHVLRIRGVGGSAPTLERLINPVQLWQQRAVRVCIVL